PDRVDFLRDDEVIDAAQQGENETLIANISQPSLSNALALTSVAIDMNYSNWAVMTRASSDTNVWLRADATYRLQEGGLDTQTGAPLLISFVPPGSTGKVVFSSFHIDAQRDDVTDTILRTVVGHFRSSDEDSTEEEEASDE
ncbi:MAG: hypothetical protein HN348_28505, partial [Proteobacteria bacterium]|nr:hypothetical protein [Pseudomonadota bacterium]